MARTRTKVTEETFLNNIRIYPNILDTSDWFWNFTSCWVWRGKRTAPEGYGIMYTYEYGTLRSHVYSVMRSGRVVPEDMVVDHLCEHKFCVNPDHLEVVTVGENNQRYYDRRKARSESSTFHTSREDERQLWCVYIKDAKDRRLESTDVNIAGFEAQRAYWGSWYSVPHKAKKYFERWKNQMKLLMEFSDQIITDIEAERRKQQIQGVPLSRLGMIRTLVKEALVIRSYASNEDQHNMNKLVREYDKKLQARGATNIDPAAPPDGRRKKLLPDGSSL